MSDGLLNLSPEKVHAILWQRGELRWKLKPCQEAMLDGIQASQRFKYVIKCARRLGKSYLLCILAIMCCLKKPGAQVRYAAPTAKALRKIVRPIMSKILKECPSTLRPEFRSAEGCYVFPNGPDKRKPYDGGSVIHLAGVNGGHADDLRGTECDLFLIDEARDIDELHYLVHDVAIPQFLDVDGAVVAGRKLVVASSPAQNKAHEFSIMADEAKLEGYYSHYDIFAGGYAEETIRLFFKEDGLPDSDVDALLSGRHQDIKSTTVKREYLALDVIDTDVAIIPEWTDRLIVERRATEFDPFYHRYMFMDMGIQRDLTVVQFAIYDFLQARLHIEDELVISGPMVTTPMIAREIFKKTGIIGDDFLVKELLERVEGLQTNFNEVAPRKEYANCYRRIADNSHPLLLNDLSSTFNISFTPTSKDKLHEMVNFLRTWVRRRSITVDPKCTHTIGSLESAVWNLQRTEFARSRIFGHFDAVASLVYGVRGVDTQTNPIPANHGLDKYNVLILNQPKRLSSAAQSLSEAFRLPIRK